MPHLTAEFVPKIRTWFVADDGREFLDLAAAMVDWMEDEKVEGIEVYKRGYLNRKECRAFWRWLGRIDLAPRKLRIYLDRKDFEAAFEAAFPEAVNKKDGK